MLLKNDSMAGVEIMTYLMFILLITGSWLLLNRQSQHGRDAEFFVARSNSRLCMCNLLVLTFTTGF